LEEYKHLSDFSTFRNGVTSAENAKCLGCTLTSKTDKNVACMKGLVTENRKVAIHEVAKVMRI
jgi:hypothetical protein